MANRLLRHLYSVQQRQPPNSLRRPSPIHFPLLFPFYSISTTCTQQSDDSVFLRPVTSMVTG